MMSDTVVHVCMEIEDIIQVQASPYSATVYYL